jgi:hypothetical protein
MMAVDVVDLDSADRTNIFDQYVLLPAAGRGDEGTVLNIELVGFVGDDASDTAKDSKTAA